MCLVDTIMEAALQTVPNWQIVDDFCPSATEFAGIQAITYDGLTVEGGKTTTFAYLGIPETATAQQPAPAIVLVHGGGGQAFLPWVSMWKERGYAAIAMSTRGYFPNDINAGSRQPGDPGYRHGMYGSFVKEGYVDSPDEDAMRNTDIPVAERWITHALVKVVHAHNLLRSLPQVDNDKIGITGISWGGNITAMAITHDPRFAFAVPVYGAGYLSQALSYMGPIFRKPGNAQFHAENRFDRVKSPVLWLAWNDDNSFSVQSNSLSYLATAPNNPKTILALIHNLEHTHPAGWNQPMIAAFADWAIQDGQPLITFATQPEGKNAWAELKIPAGVDNIKASLYWIDEPMTASPHDKYNYNNPGVESLTFMDQTWQIAPASVSGSKVSATLPEDAAGYYLEVSYEIAGQTMFATSVYITL